MSAGLLRRLDNSLGRLWARLDRVIFADYPRMDSLLCSNWFVPLLMILCVTLPLLLFLVL